MVQHDIKKEMTSKKPHLKTHLEKLYKTYGASFLSSDPLWFVHQFKRDRDREIIGLIASALAYGRVEGIKKSIERVLNIMGWKPYEFTVKFAPHKYKKQFASFRHRFNNGEDVMALIYFIRQMLDGYGSVKGFFLEGYREDDINIKNALTSFSERALNLNAGGIYGGAALPEKAGVKFFFPSPSEGSACKRLNMYLRWMVRKDTLDFGIWKEIPKEKLIIPLDTHVARISRHIGLTKRNSSDWKTAEEITGALKKLDPKDPVRYDFSISRLGILKECLKKKDAVNCKKCLIKDVCVLR